MPALWTDAPAVPEYPPLPSPPAQGDDEPRAHYAARLFAWFLAGGNTATPTDDDLALAQYGARMATDVRGALPAYYDRVADAERLIAGAIRRRALLDAQEPAQVAGGTNPAQDNAGPMARLQPAPDRNPTPPTTYAPEPVTAARAALDFARLIARMEPATVAGRRYTSAELTAAIDVDAFDPHKRATFRHSGATNEMLRQGAADANAHDTLGELITTARALVLAEHREIDPHCTCPDCVRFHFDREDDPHERGDDDGREYADPRGDDFGTK